MATRGNWTDAVVTFTDDHMCVRVMRCCNSCLYSVMTHDVHVNGVEDEDEDKDEALDEMADPGVVMSC